MTPGLFLGDATDPGRGWQRGWSGGCELVWVP